MSSHWQCPKCKTIFEKTGVIKAAEQMHQSGVPVSLGSPIHCPVCEEGIDEQAFFAGKYDHKLLERPSATQLDQEARDIFTNLMIEATVRDIGDTDAVARFATNGTAQALFQKYGLTQAEFVEVMGRVLSSQ